MAAANSCSSSSSSQIPPTLLRRGPNQLHTRIAEVDNYNSNTNNTNNTNDIAQAMANSSEEQEETHQALEIEGDYITGMGAQLVRIPTMAGDLVLAHEQQHFYLEGNIQDLPPPLQAIEHHAHQQPTRSRQLSGVFAYFYPYDGSEPSLLLIGKDFYLNLTPQHQIR